MDRDKLHFKSIKIPEYKSEMLERCLGQIAKGLQYLHSNNLAHRDIKPANILHDSSRNWKITDFGLTREIAFSMTSKAGTREYLAPEQGDKHYDAKVDIFALGLIAFEIACPLENRMQRIKWFTKFRTARHSLSYFPVGNYRPSDTLYGVRGPRQSHG